MNAVPLGDEHSNQISLGGTGRNRSESDQPEIPDSLAEIHGRPKTAFRTKSDIRLVLLGLSCGRRIQKFDLRASILEISLLST